MARSSVAGLMIAAGFLVSGSAEPGPAAVAPLRAETVRFGEAEVARFLESVNPTLSPGDVRRAAAAVIRYSAKYGLDPMLVTQVLWVESAARPWARSPMGAVGLMQVMPHMAEQLGLSGSLAGIETNLEAGCWILADNIRRLGEEDGISAYFWGSDIRSVAYLQRVREARAAVRDASES